jgi:hypothetical protein
MGQVESDAVRILKTMQRAGKGVAFKTNEVKRRARARYASLPLRQLAQARKVKQISHGWWTVK